MVPAQSGFKIESYAIGIKGSLFQDNTNSAAFINAKFNQTVSWVLTIKGQTSGAIRAFNGISNSLDSNNNIWHGESGNQDFFVAENVTFSLKVDGYDSVYTKTTTIYTAYNYNDRIKNGVKTTIVDDMEGGYTYSFFGAPYHDADPQEMKTFQSNAKFTNFAGYYNADGSPSSNIQGKYSYYFSGNDYNYNTYVGGTNTNVLTSLAGKINSSDPNEVYINLYVYGFNTPNTALNIALYELDSLSNRSTSNLQNLQSGIPSGAEFTNYLDNYNDVWQIEVPVNWQGWQLVSLKYNQFRKHNTLGDWGNHILEPQKLGGMAIELDSYAALDSARVMVAIDYVTVTEGGAFSLAK
jgi:hypothetical protein